MKILKSKILQFAVALLALSACDNKLDQVKPTQSIDESTALSTSQDIEVTLIGAYDGLSSSNSYGGAIQYSGDLIGDDQEVRFAGTFSTMDEIWRKTFTTSNTQTQATWLQSYSTINRVNNILANLDKVEASRKSAVEGESKFIRAISYFDLVRLWAKDYTDGSAASNLGVPLVTTPTRGVTDIDNRPRATVEAVYNLVLEDLKSAESLLEAGFSPGFATKGAVQALMARVYLQQGKYAEARDAANKVINSGEYQLTSTFEEAFSDDTNDDEAIFKIIVTDQDGSNSMNTFYAPSTYQGRGDVRVQNKHLAVYEADDSRGSFFVKASNNTFTGKFLDRFGDVLVIRLAEMYLIRAECNQRLNTAIGAAPLVDINKIRSRAGASTLSAVTLDDIIKERKLELAFEGQQVFDAKRLKKSIGSLAFNSPKLVIPIPQREMDTNKSLVQNDGY
ncbi:MAG: RagB/SusD family nutrient uptake outer membrane protein [Cytophagaceae bacterium]|nr:RagB/SusD family nutrient uptake outer membrane protein [Cytophagaceae bacterium]MBK9934334.1 RagB/SusD family nutrient uptake outer membrane protein [Cytophagaceae bacterium]MBL0300782.1 RagB/SusD family nutrient uptake outer membrane protein [Cytophagaceae bacterium]MBL0327725.1 RagB/SusD family nutrient uptake outer membrane protein [Cytophagaceae bacterium]